MRKVAAGLGVADGDTVRVVSRRRQIEIAALDPIAKIPEFNACAVRIEPACRVPAAGGGGRRP